jgi:hypothetical protein
MTMVWPACHFQNGFLIKSIFIDFFAGAEKEKKPKENSIHFKTPFSLYYISVPSTNAIYTFKSFSL